MSLIKTLSYYLLCLLFCQSCSDNTSLTSSKEEKSIRPNIIFLLTDDQRADALGAAGNNIIQTPNLNQLADAGIRFTNAYVTTSICMISRASILTGQYAARHGINNFQTSLDSLQLANSYPVLLRKHGYRTGFVGKYGVGNPKKQPAASFDFWAATPLHQPKYENQDSLGNYLHYTDLVGEKIEQFLAQNDDRPFALSVSFKAPHSEDGDPRQFIPHPRYADLYKDIEIPLAKTATKDHLQALPACLRNEKNIARQRWHLRFDTPEKYQASVKNYYRLITGVDDALGQLRRQLEGLNLAENTVIVYMGDNGFYLGEHGLAGKWFGHEESIRVPLIIYDPRAPKAEYGLTSDLIALNIDIAPTLLAFAGIEPPKSIQGTDLMAALKNDSFYRPDFFYEHRFLGSPRLPVSEGVVSTKMKYLYYPEHDAEELFDLRSDPGEANNLAYDQNHFKELNEMRQRYAALKAAVN